MHNATMTTLVADIKKTNKLKFGKDYMFWNLINWILFNLKHSYWWWIDIWWKKQQRQKFGVQLTVYSGVPVIGPNLHRANQVIGPSKGLHQISAITRELREARGLGPLHQVARWVDRHRSQILNFNSQFF